MKRIFFKIVITFWSIFLVISFIRVGAGFGVKKYKITDLYTSIKNNDTVKIQVSTIKDIINQIRTFANSLSNISNLYDPNFTLINESPSNWEWLNNILNIIIKALNAIAKIIKFIGALTQYLFMLFTTILNLIAQIFILIINVMVAVFNTIFDIFFGVV